MFNRHPLDNPSLAPFGLAMPISQARLGYATTNDLWVNPEKIIARMWDRCNRANASHPLPVQTIVHSIMPGMAQANRISAGNFVFDGLPYITRDIVLLSTVVQWFGTSCGRCFLEEPIMGGVSHPEREFVEKFRRHERLWNNGDLASFFCHVCTPRCATNKRFHFMESSCYYLNSQVSARDRSVIHALMWWLGKQQGREFAADFLHRKQRACIDASARRMKKILERRAA